MPHYCPGLFAAVKRLASLQPATSPGHVRKQRSAKGAGGSTALSFTAASLVYLFLPAQAAIATQTHGAPEGLYVHQMAHFLFMFSLGVLIYWLRQHSLIEEPGWRYVQYAAFFLILWNLDAALAHYLDGRSDLFKLDNEDSWSARFYLLHGSGKLLPLYYCAKLDHLFCVPGILFLYAGLRRLLKQV
ncbi:MAG: hypothetical protein ACP5IL_08480 [Syntrophobacteraceae bacterium]